MHIISRKTLRMFSAEHPDAEEPLNVWYHTVKRAHWKKYADLKSLYAAADVVGKYTVINLCGNKYRMILEVIYESGVVLIRHVLTHKEYDANKWRKDAFNPPPRQDRPKKKEGRNGDPDDRPPRA